MTRAARGLTLGLVAYAALLVGSILLLRQEPVAESSWRYAAALLPLPAVIVVVGAGMAAFRASDELAQRIYLNALALSFLGTVLVALTWGLLEGVGLPALSGFVYVGVLWLLYLVGLWLGNRRYR